jgi:NAD(P)-dependent dehydrogenase (short-subunit alcohol dehydrogenase family)
MSIGLFDLRGRVAVVTGGSRGLGQYFGRALARAGADLVITSRNPASLEEFKAEIEGLGRQALPLELDVRDYASIQNMVEGAVRPPAGPRRQAGPHAASGAEERHVQTSCTTLKLRNLLSRPRSAVWSP